MTGRFHTLFDLIDLSGVNRWLDIGCGPGTLFEQALQAGYEFDFLKGVDISSEMIKVAKSKRLSGNIEFSEEDLELSPGPVKFDFVSMIGVLQQCAIKPVDAFKSVAQKMNPGGRFFFTTKHIGWVEFTSGRLEPERGHSWFSMPDLRDGLDEAGFSILHEGGLLPVERKFVSPEDSHTVYFLVELK
ncbi:class I SAM-dependent methyltransferase [Desulfovibrio sp. JC010]|uniref:class I SAM-dependent DNA methyltransferase n=1 Tax=Desulfovibrio sp. JC010 TaxID=2593641 RepID=UPI0013D50391|nr:class I SAM-dependent methyltransferase [Desulfovibrio sp. JC010]NDV26708.1 class I SAM-dependent methyltransferase [Desulfovibrio sp. JC010]